MDAFVFYPENQDQFNELLSFSSKSNIKNALLNENEKKRLAGILLSNLAQKNPKAYATDEEIISVVEEVRHKRYGKKD
jgi:hypothetical protein